MLTQWHLYYIVVIQICNVFCITLLYYIFALHCNIPLHATASHNPCLCHTSATPTWSGVGTPCHAHGHPIANQLVWHHVPHRRWVGFAMQLAFVLHCCNTNLQCVLYYIVALHFCITLQHATASHNPCMFVPHPSHPNLIWGGHPLPCPWPPHC